MTHIRASRFLSVPFISALFIAGVCASIPVRAQEATETEVAPDQAVPAQAVPAQAAPPVGESALPDDMGPDAAPPASDTVQAVVAPAADLIPKVDPIALYGNDMQFDVYRKGTKIGKHQVNFARNGDDLTVTSQMELAVDVLFFTAYRFEYESTEVWRDNQLVAVTATVNDNGKIAKTNARMEDGLLKIDGPRGTYLASSWVFPTNHWHRGQAISGSILNTLNGRLTKVEIVHKGIEAVDTAQGAVEAEHLEYTGQLRDTDVWYDANNRWVKMRFKAKDKSLIEYRCRQCGLAPGVPATIATESAPATGTPAAIQQEATGTAQ